MSAGAYFPYGQSDYENPIACQNVWGSHHNSRPQDNAINSWIEVVDSDRRNQGSGPNDFMVELTKTYVNVYEINMLSARIPVSDEVIAKGSFYMFLESDGHKQGMDNVSIAGVCNDKLSTTGAFAHIFVDGEPTIISQFKQYPRVFRFQTPENLGRFDVKFFILPDDPTVEGLVPMPFDENEKVMIDFEIIAQDGIAKAKTKFS